MLWYNIDMKPLHRKKAITLYETRMRVGYVVKTVVCYVFAAIIWYMLAVVLPYTVTLNVSPADNARLTRAAFSATQQEISRDDADKERALLLPTSEQSFYRRLRLVEDAKESIDYMVYDTYEQEWSYYYYTALVRAADRGVKVRIVLDGKMGRLSGSLKTIGNIVSNHKNIELYYFNPINLLDPAGLMALMHDKVTVVDGRILIVGGVNMGTGAYLANFDMEVMITNSGAEGAAGQAKRYFEKMIANDLCERIVSKKVDYRAKAEYERKYIEFYENSEFATAEVDYSKLGVAIDKATFVSNKISAEKKPPIILQAVYNMMESSQKTVVVTPYTLLENDKKAKLRSLAAKNDEFKLITNSLYNTRNVGYADYYHTRESYIDKNITLLEYQAKNQLHAKMFTFDGRYSIIGSFNLDERSAHIDTESVVVIDSPTLTAQLDSYIDETFVANSLQVGSNNEYLPSDTVKSHSVPTKKRFIYGIYSALGIIRCLI